jgi:ubiquinone/menaquinone biosynthesis C-methylase UbiE
MSNVQSPAAQVSSNGPTSNVQPHNTRAQSVWNSAGGKYDEISRSIADAIEHAVERLQLKHDERVLDLATGTGWGSRIIAQRFDAVKITGADIADQMLEYARAQAATQKLNINYLHADAEHLPFADGAFDAAVSTFGVMFVGKPEAAADELARVVKKGGRIVLATWKHDGNVAQMFGVMKKYMAAPPTPAPPSPFEWGKISRLQELLGQSFDLSFEEGINRFRYGSGEQAFNLWAGHYGPAKTLAGNLDAARLEEFKRDMIAWHETFRSGELGYDQPRTYVITRGIRK